MRTRFSRLSLIAILLSMVVTAACGSGSTPTSPSPAPVPSPSPTPSPSPSPSPAPPVATTCPPPYRAGSMNATIDGSSWNAVCVFATSIFVPAPVGGIFSVGATDAANTSPRVISFAVHASGPGTYPIDNGTLSLGNAIWTVANGTVTLTTFTTTGASGTFSFTANGNGTRIVNNGAFTVTF